MLSIDSPRERLIHFGAEALSDVELLAIILRSGGVGNSVISLSKSLLMQFGGIKGLVNTNLHQLQNIKDIGITKAVTIKAMSELSLRLFTEDNHTRKTVSSPNDVYGILKKDFYLKTREHLILLSLDSRKKVVSKDLISIGTINETLVHPREVYRQALLRNAVSIVLAHNHPSGDSSPSSEDILLTERVAKAGQTLGIGLIDHVIVSDKGYTSLKALNLFELNHSKEGR